MEVRNQKEVKALVEKNSVFKMLNAVMFALVTNRKDIKLSLNVGGGSHTDNKTVTVGIAKLFWNLPLKDVITMLLALLGHETQHVKSSNFEAYSKFLDEMQDYLAMKGANKKIARKVAQAVGNSVEDGRIEKILVNQYKSYLDKIKFLNGFFWENQQNPEQELQYFLYCITIYSVMGIMPKGHKDTWSGTELDSVINTLKPLIIEGINARTCSDGLDICRKIIFKSEDYILKLIQEAQDEMDNMPSNPNFSNSEESETGEGGGESAHFRPEPKQKKSSDSEDSEEDSEEDESSASNNGESDDESDDEDSKEGSGSKESSDKEDSEEDESSASNNGESDDESDDEDSNEGSGSKEDSEEDESSASNNGESDDESDDEDSQMSDEELVEKIKEAAREASQKDAENKLKEIERNEKKDEASQKEEGLTDKDSDKIKLKYGRYAVDFAEDKSFSKNTANVPLPAELKTEARKMKSEVAQIFQNKEGYNLKNQTSGNVSPKDLWRVKANQSNVFVKKGFPSRTDYVGNILIDFSGSMGRGKFLDAIKAVSVLEEAFKGLFPFKITGFTTREGWNQEDILHIPLKGFNDVSTSKNYSWSFGHNRSGMSGNMDGFSIRVATRELLNRSEKDKILIILSDGLPAEYSSYDEAINDVKSAVKEAQKAGITVVSIAFGSEREMMQNEEAYRHMYGRHLIMCEPRFITKNLIKLLKSLTSR